MRRRSPVLCSSRNRPRNCASQVIFFAAAFALLLATFVAVTVRAQDTTPPPPPPDQSASPAEAPGQTQIRAVRISDVEGKVQVFEGKEIAFDQAEPNMPAVEGMRLVTGDNGRFEIQFEDGSVARVTPDSSIRLTQMRRNADGSTVTQIDALTGLSYYELNGVGGEYSVHFGVNAATPVKSAAFRVGLDTAPNTVAVMHGTVHIDDGMGLSMDIHPSQTFQTDPQQPGQFTLAQNITADSWDQWNSDRDEAMSRLQTNQTMARASSGNADNPAWNDLDYYGNWYNLPGYGQAWAPAGVGPGWDPFGAGAWGYYQGAGYTWISGYPWGWFPYHCGAWDYIDNGWLWFPGNCGYGFYGEGWYPYSTVWNMPPGYIPPARPRNLPPINGPRPRPIPVGPRLITVNRGAQNLEPFQPGAVKAAPRTFNFEGKAIAPLEAGIHPIQRGPLGESFTAAVVRTHPEMGSVAGRATFMSGPHGLNAPGTALRTPGAPATFNAPRYGGAPSAGGAAHGSFSAGAEHGSSGGGGFSGGSHASAPSGGGSAPSGGGGHPH